MRVLGRISFCKLLIANLDLVGYEYRGVDPLVTSASDLRVRNLNSGLQLKDDECGQETVSNFISILQPTQLPLGYLTDECARGR